MDEEIRSSWAAERNRADPALQALLPEEPPQSIWNERYYDVAHMMFSARLTVHDNTGLSQEHSGLSQDHAGLSQDQSSLSVQHGPLSTDGIGRGSNTVALGAMGPCGSGISFPNPMTALLSAMTSTPVQSNASSATFDYISASAINEGQASGTNMILEGWVVEQQNIQPRTVQSSPKRGKERSVIDYMSFDGTSPMKVSLWDEAAEDFLKLVNMQQTEEKVLIEVKGVRVNPVPKN